VEKETRNLKGLKVLAYTSSAIHVLLALNYFPVVPFLGWLNFGHGDWATAWIPDALLLVVLPAGYFIYWHFWFVIAAPAFLGSLYLYKRTGNRNTKILTVVNAVTVVIFWVVRITLGILDIHPDIV